ncbi:phasin family protein [Halomonas sp. HNIBRBA4712]|uniref:phasin family protein n=1 Tax=Halomonas sp. HNIBRBA4712 TaxID=3373087 RepID=UPI0037462079
MSAFDQKPLNEQFHTLFVAPVQAFVSLGVDASEKLISAQLDAQKAYLEMGLTQTRQLIEVKDGAELKAYMEGQQGVAKNFVERVKSDADQVSSIQRDFLSQSQKLTEQNVQKAQEAAQNFSKSA